MKYDIAIIGGSLSGSAAASHLSALGFSVALIDKQEFPRRKACGEGLSAAGRRALEGAKIVDFRELSHKELSFFCINVGKKVRIPISSPITGVSRLSLDAAVYKHAASSPYVNTFIGESVRKISRDKEFFKVKTDSISLTSSSIIIASGFQVPKISGISIKEAIKTRDRYGLSFHASGLSSCSDSESGVVIYPSGSSETYITPIGDGVFNISYLGTREDLRRFMKDRALSQFLESKGYSEPLDAPMGRGPFFSVKRTSLHPGFKFAGDALNTLDPIGGMGMTHAILSGLSAGEAVAKELRGDEAMEPIHLGSLERLTAFSSLGISFLNSNRGILEKLPAAPFVLTGAFFMNALFRKIISVSEQILTL